jgi:nucleoside-diphosphate-sugar epimerase
VLFASSREVYGQAAVLPATEDTPLAPLNVYGRTKVAGEGLLAEAGAAGLATASVRLSNVFGDPLDHPDRVVPAFLRAAAAGAALRVDGPACSFDFTYLDDVVTALLTVTELLARERRSLPPVHLVTGVPTTLGELAALALRVTRSQAPIESLSSRPFDVARFHGDPGRARALLGWTAETPLEEGLARLAAALGPRSP